MAYIFGYPQAELSMKLTLGSRLKLPLINDKWEDEEFDPDTAATIANGIASIVGQTAIADRTAALTAEREVTAE